MSNIAGFFFILPAVFQEAKYMYNMKDCNSYELLLFQAMRYRPAPRFRIL